ncbi:MAG TPA: sensor domain-containing diguanylate cyclase [Polyangia bacterium]|jgi:diguanylate cyclase (GGDEF)-like protein|nr:sensor domain-containing diguanylate cyclase [Polyangia bacterium]
MADQDPPPSDVPRRRTEEMSVPTEVIPVGPILTLSPEEIARFFVRARRDQDTEHWDVRLDGTLREILERANDFVPSEMGGILLDDPRAKLAGSPAPRLTYIAAFGPGIESLVGKRLPSDRGFSGRVYTTGRPKQTDQLEPDDPLLTLTPEMGSVRSLVAVPIVVGESICGILQLANRRSGTPYTPRDKELLRIFAAYMSSSIQNALDAIRARTQARMDDLTGLANSRYFHTRLADEIARADRDGTEIAMLFIDLDQFKGVNDMYGHLAGSWTLQKVGRLLADHAPPAALVARYGGDEFVVILPGADLARAAQTAETLRRTIADTIFFDLQPENRRTPMPQPPPRITASIGVSSYRDHLPPGGSQRRRESTLLRLADLAMYRAKAAGRNRVEIADPEE